MVGSLAGGQSIIMTKTTAKDYAAAAWNFLARNKNENGKITISYEQLLKAVQKVDKLKK